MRYLTSFLFTLLIVVAVQAQDAENFFHRGANSFINSQLDQATQIVDEGLFQFPNDAKLNALKKTLEEEKEKQKQQQKQQQNQEQKEEEQKPQEQEPQEQEKEKEQKQQEEPKPQDGQEIESKEISKEDAEKILKALAQKEKELLKDFKKKKLKDSATHDKDW